MYTETLARDTQRRQRQQQSFTLLALMFILQMVVLAAHPYQHAVQTDQQDCEICVIVTHMSATQADTIVVAMPTMLAMMILQAQYAYLPNASAHVSTRAPPGISGQH
jgi:hypothetical protein